MNFAIVLLITIIPVFLLCLYIYHEDRYEKESIPFLIQLFVLGIICGIVSVFIKNMERLLLNNIFAEHIFYSREGMLVVSQEVRWIYNLLLGIFMYSVTDVVIIESTLYLFSFKNRNFNSLFDGIVYAVYVIMGFAFVEVVLFGYLNGWDLLAVKCLTTLPMRMLTGAILGYNYSGVKIYHMAKAEEQRLCSLGVTGIKPFFKYRKQVIVVCIVPWIIWGLSEYATLMGDALWRYIYYLSLMVLYLFVIRKITRISENDALLDGIVKKVVGKKYGIDYPQDNI